MENQFSIYVFMIQFNFEIEYAKRSHGQDEIEVHCASVRRSVVNKSMKLLYFIS